MILPAQLCLSFVSNLVEPDLSFFARFKEVKNPDAIIKKP